MSHTDCLGPYFGGVGSTWGRIGVDFIKVSTNISDSNHALFPLNVVLDAGQPAVHHLAVVPKQLQILPDLPLVAAALHHLLQLA